MRGALAPALSGIPRLPPLNGWMSHKGLRLPPPKYFRTPNKTSLIDPEFPRSHRGARRRIAGGLAAAATV